MIDKHLIPPPTPEERDDDHRRYIEDRERLVGSLNREIGNLRAELATLRADHAATVAELTELLRRFEWRERTVNGVVIAFLCPSCGVLQGMDHVTGCRLHNALATPSGSGAAAVLAAVESWADARRKVNEGKRIDLAYQESMMGDYIACQEELEQAVAAWRAARDEQGGTK